MKFWFWEILGFIWALPITILGLLLLLVILLVNVLAYGGAIDFYHREGLRVWVLVDSLWFLRGRFTANNLAAFNFVKADRFNKDISKWSKWQHQLYDHEDEHRRQCWILGLFMLVIWPLTTLLAWVMYNKYYRACFLEIMARWKAGQGLEP